MALFVQGILMFKLFPKCHKSVENLAVPKLYNLRKNIHTQVSSKLENLSDI
jgi:hypothetical protein